jgi:predicted dehydrogenase
MYDQGRRFRPANTPKETTMPRIDPSRTPLILPSRRSFIGGLAAGAAAGTIAAGRAVHAGGSEEIRVALVGCGSRGGGAAVNALKSAQAPLKVYAMADVFKDRIGIAKRSLTEQFKERVDVPEDRAFIGFEAYRQAMDALRPGDIVILATPPAFRAAHFAAAIEKGLHVFMEKPVSIDGPSTNRIIALAAKANEKNLKVGVGLMCRHCRARGELFDRLQNGEAGEQLSFYGYRMHPAAQSLDLWPGPPEGMTELQWQVKRFHGFLWASGGIFSDYYVHHIDEVCWMKGAWPAKAEAVGGRHYPGKMPDQNFDNYAVEYTFSDGTKFHYYGQHIKNGVSKFGVFGVGSKGAFTISERGHHPAKSTIYKGQAMKKDAILWTAEQPEPNPYGMEWEHLVNAIVKNEPYNEAVRGAEASLATAMGRFAAHTGKPVTYDEMLAMTDDLTAGVENLKDDSPAPVARDADGNYPVPMPGRYKFEYHD